MIRRVLFRTVVGNVERLGLGCFGDGDLLNRGVVEELFSGE